MKKPGVTIWLTVAVVIIAIFVIPSPLSRAANNFFIKITKPLSASTVVFGYKISSFFSLLTEINSLQKDNQSLAQDLVRSKVDSAKLIELEAENTALKKQLEYKKIHPELKLLSARVIGLDPTNLYDTLVIDRGSSSGISAGMAVTSLGVLVGKIDQVSPESSRVLLVTSKDSIIQVMLLGSRTVGILKGGISGMTIQDIPLDTQVSAGEEVITSGLGGNLPEGIFVGNTGREMSTKSDIFKVIEIISPIDFSKLESLFVVIEG
jgi:rod shape-determining protein MreC